MATLLKELNVGSTGGGTWYLRIYQESVSQSIENNTSSIKLKLTLRGTATGGWVTFDRRSAWIGNTSFDITYRQDAIEHDLGVTTITVGHSADGSGSYSVGFGISTSYVLNGSGTVSGILPTIPRASSIGNITGGTLGSAITVPINRATSSFTHTVTYTLGSIVRDYAGQGTSCTFTPPISDASQIANDVTGTVTISVQTYNGSTKIGGPVSKTLTIKVPDSVIPSFTSLDIVRVDNGVPSAWGLYVQGKSKATLSIIGASGIYGSVIKSFLISGGGFSTTASSFTTGVLNGVAQVTFTATITDSRGRTVTKNVTIDVWANIPPSLTLKAERCNSSGVVTDSGTYLKITPVYSCASINAKNYIASKSFKITGTSYANTSASSGTGFVLGNNDIAISKTYEVVGVVTDALGQSSGTIKYTVSSSAVPFDLRDDQNGAAFGKYAEKSGALDVAWAVNSDIGFYKGADYLQPMHKDAYGYWGFTELADYLRTPPNGILPNKKGDWGGYVGTLEWPFFEGNFKNLNKGGIGVPNNFECPERVAVSGWDEAWKFPSGLMILRSWNGFNISSFNAWGQVFSYNIPAKSIPAGTFIMTPSFYMGVTGVANGFDGNSWCAMNGGGSVSQFPSSVIVRPTNYATGYTYSPMCIGRWK